MNKHWGAVALVFLCAALNACADGGKVTEPGADIGAPRHDDGGGLGSGGFTDGGGLGSGGYTSETHTTTVTADTATRGGGLGSGG